MCDDLTDEESDQADDCAFEIILREIINNQNAQIQTMRGILDAKSYPEEDDCKVIMKVTDESDSLPAIEADPVQDEQSDSLEVCLANCVADADTGEEVCTFTTKVNLYAGELGYYQFEECGDETNPTLGLEVGKTYEFVQKDPSN